MLAFPRVRHHNFPRRAAATLAAVLLVGAPLAAAADTLVTNLGQTAGSTSTSGSWSSASGTGPALESAAVNGGALVLSWDEALDEGAVPAPAAFSVSVDGAAGAAPVAVRVSGAAVTLSLRRGVAHGQTVTVSYTPDARPLQDAYGNAAAGLDRHPVANETLPVIRPRALVGNLGQAGRSPLSNLRRHAQSFRTGDAPTRLHSIDVGVGAHAADFNIGDLVVTLAASSGGRPGATVATLTSPATPRSQGTDRFTAPPGTMLEAGTTYFVVLEYPSANDRLFRYTSSDGEDSGAQSGWSIGDTSLRSAGSSGGWSSNLFSHAIRVNGSSREPRITGVAVTSVPRAASDTYGEGERIEVTVTFDRAVKVPGPSPSLQVLIGTGEILGLGIQDQGRISTDSHTELDAAYASGSGTGELVFRTGALASGVPPDRDGISISGRSLRATTIHLDDPLPAPIVSVAGEQTPASYDLPELLDLPGHKVDVTLLPKPPSPEPPVPQSAAVDGRTLALAWDGALDSSSTPAAQWFAVRVNGARRDVSGVSIAGSTATLTRAAPVRPTPAVTVSYTADASPLRDPFGNAAGDLVGRAVANVVPPALAAGTPPAVTGKALVLTFDAALDESSVPAADAFTVQADSAGRTVSAVAVAGRTVTLTLARAAIAGEAVTVAYTKPGNDALADADGREVADFGATSVANRSAACPLDQPSDAFWAACLTLGSDGGSAIGFGAGFGALVPAAIERGGTGHEVAALALDSGRFALRFAADPGTIANDWVLQVEGSSFALADATRDQAGHRFTWSAGAPAWSAGDAGDPVSVSLRDAVAPALASATFDRDRLVLTFDEALDEDSVPAAGDFAVSVDAGAGTAPARVVVDGATVTLTLAARVGSGQAVTVSYTAGANPLEDLSGNPAASFDAETVTHELADDCPAGEPADTFWRACLTVGRSGPSLHGYFDDVSDAYGSLSPAEFERDGDRRTVEGLVDTQKGLLFRFSGERRSAMNGWVLDVDGTTLALGSATFDTSTRTFTWSSPGFAWDDADVGLKVPVGLRDAGGPELESAAVDGGTLVLTFDEYLDTGSVPATDAWAVTVGEAAAAVTGVTMSGPTVTLALAAPVGIGQPATVGYTAGARPLRDLSGNAAADFSGRSVDDDREVGLDPGTPPVVTGRSLVLTFNGALDANSVPAVAAFTVTRKQPAPEISRTVSSVAVDGATVTLNLVLAAVAGEAFTVSYEKPGSDPLKDARGREVAGFGDTTVTNRSAACPGSAPGGAFWNACLTLGKAEGSTLIVGFINTGPQGALSPAQFDDQFEAGHEVTSLVYNGTSDELAVGFAADPRPGANGWTLQVGGRTWSLGTAAYSTRTFSWSAAGFAWTSDDVGDKVTVSLRPSDLEPPLLAAATVAGDTLVLIYDEPLDEASEPATDAFSVAVDGGAGAAPSAVSVSGRTVTLTLATAVAPGQTVALDYTAPETGAIRDPSGNTAPGLTGEPVAYETTDLVLSATQVTVDEEAGTATFEVSLASAPSATVTVAVASGDPDAATAAPASLTFTTSAWADAQEVTATGVPDADSDHESVTVTLTASGGGYADVSGTVTVTVDDDEANHPATGRPAISGAATVGGTLTAARGDVADADGLPASDAGLSWQWVRQDDARGAGAEEIPAATGATYVLTADDAGKWVAVKVGFTDNRGTAETRASEAVGPVATVVTLVLAPAAIAESGAADRATVTATASAALEEAFTVTVTAAAVAPAVAGDFTLSADPTLSFAAGDTAGAGSVTITAVDNPVDAAAKTVAVSATVNGGAPATVPDAVTLTITDDDEVPGAPAGLSAVADNGAVRLA